MKLNSIINNIGTFLFSLFVCLVLVEIGARLTGSYYLHKQLGHVKISPDDKNEIRIMALGESTTALGLGVSWPSILEKLLKKKYPQSNIIVINEGLSGTDTEEILENLPRKIEKYHPQIVITMIGINDKWNFEQSPQAKIHPKVSFNQDNQDNQSEKISINNIWHKFRIYKMFNLFLVNLKYKNKMRKINDKLIDAFTEFKKEEINLTKIISNHPDNLEAQRKLRDLYFNMKIYRKAFPLARNIVKKTKISDLDYFNDMKVYGLTAFYADKNEWEIAKNKFKQLFKIKDHDQDLFKVFSEFNKFSGLASFLILMGQELLNNHHEITKEMKITLLSQLGIYYLYGPHTYNLESAEKCYKQLTKYLPRQIDWSSPLIKILWNRNKYQAAINEFHRIEKFIQSNKHTQNILFPKSIYQEALNVYVVMGNEKEAKSFIEKTPVNIRKNLIKLDRDYLISSKANSYGPRNNTLIPKNITSMYTAIRTKNNYQQIIRWLLKNHITPIAMSYPNRSINEIKDILESENINGVIYVDNEPNFREALTKHSFQDLFVDDFAGNFGHFSELGATLVSNQIINTFERYNFASNLLVKK